MNILILRVSSIGDVIHTLPCIFFIKKVYPNAKISWVVQKKAADLLTNQPFLENVWILPDKFLAPKNWKNTFQAIKPIRKIKWDAILDFQGIPKTSCLLPFLHGSKYGFDFNNSRLWLTSFFTSKHTTPSYTNIIQKNLALTSNMLQHLLPKHSSSCPSMDSLKEHFKLNVPEPNKQEIESWLKEKNIHKFIALAPNTTWQSKHWPEENWFKLIKLLLQDKTFTNKYSIVLIGKDFGQQAQNLANKIKTENLNVFCAPSWNLISTNYLISKSSLLVAPDTGLLHIADFLEKKAIGIFGPTSSKKHGPFLSASNIKNAIQVNCPHHYQKTHGNIGKNNKKYSIKHDCMYKLSPESLFKKILQVLIGEQE